MEKVLYLVRHGQTLFNVQHKIQGWCDSPLTDLGIEQAKRVKNYFDSHDICFDHAYSSTSERCCDTIQIITDMPYKRLKGLKEFNFGVFEGKDECLNPPLPYNDFFKQFSGESQVEVQQRMVSTLTDIMSKEDHHVVLAVSHGGACANFIRAFEKSNVINYRKGIKNCTIFKIMYNGNDFSLVEIIEEHLEGL